MVRHLHRFLLIQVFTIPVIIASGQQSPVFTQYHFNQQIINPAYTGVWEKKGFFSLIRKELGGDGTVPFTQMASFYSPLKNEYVGMGFTLTNERYSTIDRYTVFADYSYGLRMSKGKFLRLGCKFGFMNYHLIGKNIAATLPDNKKLNFLPNVGIGVFFYNEDFYAGLSIPGMIKNNIPYKWKDYFLFSQSRQFFLTTGYIFPLGDMVTFKPELTYRITAGLPMQIDLLAGFFLSDKLYLGGMIRTEEAFSIISRWKLSNNLSVGYSADFSFKKFNGHHFTTHELTLGYNLSLYRRGYKNPELF